MPAIIEETLEEIFKELGKIPSLSEDSNGDADNKEKEEFISKFMLSGKKPIELAFKFFSSAKTIILSNDSVEIVTDKSQSAKFESDILSIKPIVEMLQKKITKLECKKFNEKYLPFWDAFKSSVKEIELEDFGFDNQKYADAVKSLDSLDKATVELDIYCIGFMEGLSLKCNELFLKGEAYDQIENEEFQAMKFPSVKKLKLHGHYAGWGITDMSIESLTKNLKTGFPDLEDLTLIIDDDNVADEDAKTIIELVTKPKINDKNLKLKVIFNFTMVESKWQDTKFYAELKKYPGIEFIGSKDGSQSQLKLSDDKIIEINLASENVDEPEEDDEDDEEEEEGSEEPSAKRKKV